MLSNIFFVVPRKAAMEPKVNLAARPDCTRMPEARVNPCRNSGLPSLFGRQMGSSSVKTKELIDTGATREGGWTIGDTSEGTAVVWSIVFLGVQTLFSTQLAQVFKSGGVHDLTSHTRERARS